MAKDTDEIVVGANGTVWSAPVGTVAPATEIAAPGAGWVDLGYTSEDGVTFNDAKTLEVIRVWQLFHPARRIVTERDTTLSFVLRQWNKANVEVALDAVVTEPTPGHYKVVPPAPEDLGEKALMVDWTDGTKHYRLILARGTVADAVETNLVRTAAADLPVGFGVLGSDGVDAWVLLTDDPAFEAA